MIPLNYISDHQHTPRSHYWDTVLHNPSPPPSSHTNSTASFSSSENNSLTNHHTLSKTLTPSPPSPPLHVPSPPSPPRHVPSLPPSSASTAITSSTFTSSEEAKQHQRPHTQTEEQTQQSIALDRPHPCPVCPARFRQRSHLTAHYRVVHYKCKPFVCPFCRHPFGKKYDLKMHVAAVHFQVRAFSCDRCHRTFAKKSNLSRHRSHRHPNDPKPQIHKQSKQKSVA